MLNVPQVARCVFRQLNVLPVNQGIFSSIIYVSLIALIAILWIQLHRPVSPVLTLASVVINFEDVSLAASLMTSECSQHRQSVQLVPQLSDILIVLKA